MKLFRNNYCCINSYSNCTTEWIVIVWYVSYYVDIQCLQDVMKDPNKLLQQNCYEMLTKRIEMFKNAALVSRMLWVKIYNIRNVAYLKYWGMTEIKWSSSEQIKFRECVHVCISSPACYNHRDFTWLGLLFGI